MTKKDFELIAEALFLSREAEDDIANICQRMADTLATTNPRFDRERFLIACGVKS
jgi:hypothetical protein